MIDIAKKKNEELKSYVEFITKDVLQLGKIGDFGI